jgi:hypothetical protein
LGLAEIFFFAGFCFAFLAFCAEDCWGEAVFFCASDFFVGCGFTSGSGGSSLTGTSTGFSISFSSTGF